MERLNENAAGPYRDKLNVKAKARYLEKIKGVKGLDPYEHDKWTADVKVLPNFQHAFIYNYMILNVSAYTHEVFSNFRSLQQGHVQFTDGWVHELEISRVDQKTVVRTKVNHSMRLGQKPLQPWVILRSSGEVECAHCTCMAGVAEKCVHVAALLYKIDAAVSLRGTVTPTNVGAYWTMPSNVTKVRGTPGHSIDYTTGTARKRALDQSIGGKHSPAPRKRTRFSGRSIPQRTLGDLKALTDLMHAHRSGICSVMEDYSHHYADPVQPCILPKSLLHLRNPGMDGCDLMALQQHCEGLIHLVAVTDTEAAALEKKTRLQHKSDVWHTARAGRITASNMHAVVSTSTSRPALSTVEKVCYPNYSQRQTGNDPEPIKWGRDNEETARKSYITQNEVRHRELKVEHCGFVINPSFPELGATPDALVNCICCGKGCVEIKCPYKHRDHNILQACTDKDFCLQFTDGKLSLKSTHKYYKQVQTQIFVTGSQFCDFVVWTTKSCVCVRVTPDADLWHTTLLPKAQNFFNKVVLPELVAHHYSQPVLVTPRVEPPADAQPGPTQKRKRRGREITVTSQILKPLAPSHPGHTRKTKKRGKDNGLWCVCRQPEELDDMVACDNQNCAIQWFHLGYVGLSWAPAKGEPWLCDTCTPH